MDYEGRPLSAICFQIGEALCLDTPGVFFEAGAYDGVTQSNTYRLEKERHWRGLLVEPSPKFSELVTNRSNENTFLHAALTESQDERNLAGLFNGTLTDTADPSLVDFFLRTNRPASLFEAARRLVRDIRRWLHGFEKSRAKKISEVPGVTLAKAIADSSYSRIDLMSIDVEGMELSVLYGHDWVVRPRVIIIETRSRDSLEIIEILTSHGYQLIGSHRPGEKRKESDYLDFSNLFWVDSVDLEATSATRQALGI